MPSGMRSLMLYQTKDAVTLLKKYKDCFVNASGKVGLTDQTFCSVEAGVACETATSENKF